jgi:hypothetical protein
MQSRPSRPLVNATLRIVAALCISGGIALLKFVAF